jgi:hypothetical protein
MSQLILWQIKKQNGESGFVKTISFSSKDTYNGSTYSGSSGGVPP